MSPRFWLWRNLSPFFFPKPPTFVFYWTQDFIAKVVPTLGCSSLSLYQPYSAAFVMAGTLLSGKPGAVLRE